MHAPTTTTAIRIYYEHAMEIGNQQIMELFGASQSTASAMKKEVQQRQAEEGIKVYTPGYVNTELAYQVWGLDIDRLIRNYKKMKALGVLMDEKIQNTGI